jgi:hypothetical protein
MVEEQGVDDGIGDLSGIEIPSSNGYYSDDRMMLRGLKRAYNPDLLKDDRPSLSIECCQTAALDSANRLR